MQEAGVPKVWARDTHLGREAAVSCGPWEEREFSMIYKTNKQTQIRLFIFNFKRVSTLELGCQT